MMSEVNDIHDPPTVPEVDYIIFTKCGCVSMHP